MKGYYQELEGLWKTEERIGNGQKWKADALVGCFKGRFKSRAVTREKSDGFAGQINVILSHV
jgi:hypothetical protein